MTTEPHAVIFAGDCPACGGRGTFRTITIPKLATGEHFPQFGVCEVCEVRFDLQGSPPLTPTEETIPMPERPWMTYPIPLQESGEPVFATLHVPTDLTRAEGERIKAMIEALILTVEQEQSA